MGGPGLDGLIADGRAGAAAAALVAVVALLLLVRRLAPRVLAAGGGRTGGGRMVPLASLALDPRRRLHLIGVDGRRVVLLTGGPQDLVVGWLEPAEPGA